MRSRLVTIALLLFGSGLTSLIYQVAWMRELRLVFGFSTAASAAVVAIFLGGLGLGSRFLGKLADRAERPLELYGKLELGIAASAALTPGLLWLIRKLYLALGGSLALGLVFGSVVRLVLAAAVLLIPTFLMGGTLPAASRAVETDDDADRRRMAILYGTNTIGAVVGTALSTFWLLEVLGTRETLWAACVLNAAVALAAIAIGKKIVIRDAAPEEAEPAEQPAEPAALEPAAPRHFVLAASCIVGFAFTLMELVWYRMLAPLLGGSTYTFGLILAVALAGIGLGAAAYGRVGRGRPATLIALSATTALEALCLALPYAAGDRIAVFAALSRPLGVWGFSGYVLTWTEITVLVVLPAALVAGFQFPQLVGLLGRGRRGVGEDVGLAYAWNTLGAIGGSLAGGFGLLPILYATGSWKAVILLLIALSAWTLWLARRREAATPPRAWLPLAGMAASATSVAMLFATGPTAVWRHSPIGAGRVHLETAAPNDVLIWERDQRRLIAWDADGRESAVALLKTRGGAAFVINGKVDGNSREDAATQVMSGMVGAALHSHVRHALVVGLGTGSTAGWLGALPTIERVDVAELEKAVLGVARDCAPVNRGVLANTKVRIKIGDARELLLTTRQKYDLVFSEPSNPYRAGISSLFTQDFYQAVRERLEPGGIFVQWLQAYEVDPQTVRTVYATLASVFGSVETFSGKNDDLLLVSSEKPIRYDADELRKRLAEEPFASAMANAWRVTGLEGFLSHYVARDSLARAILRAEAGRVNTDDRNVVEFGFARSLGQGGLFQGDEMRVLAQQRGENRPAAIAGAPPDWNRVRWNGVIARTEENLAPPPATSAEEVTRLGAHSAFLAGDLRQVLGAYQSAPWEPDGPLEIAMVAEAMADGGQASALEMIEKLRPYQPAEADAILARYLWSQGRYQDCYRACAAAMGRYRVDPWPLSNLMGRFFAVLGDLPMRDPNLTPLVHDLFAQPLPLWLLDDERNYMHLLIAQYMGNDRALEALQPLEPNFPWRRDLLEQRARIYEAAKDPRARMARQELELFDRKVPAAFAQGLEMAAPAP